MIEASGMLQPEAINPWERYTCSSLTFREIPGPDPGFFLGGDVPLRNGITDW